MPRIAAVGLAVLAGLLGATELFLPPLAEERVEDRLERDGGTAEVSLSAFPAVRLLFDDGGSLEVEGSGLELTPAPPRAVLDRIDGFDEVRVRLDSLQAGPLEVSEFELLRRKDEREYRVSMSGSSSPREVARFLGTRAGGPLGGVLGDLAAGSLPGGATEVPLDLEATFESRHGETELVAADGAVAGIPAGPLVELVAETVVERL